jgi:uncharacterized membrane protein YagU involved in acid resistance
VIAASETFSTDAAKTYRAIGLAGLVAGTMDITAAFISTGLQTGRSPQFVLQSVASGLLGVDSYQQGLRSAALGLVIHFCIAYTWCTVYFIASRALTILLRRAVICGVLYGIVVWLFMNGVVLPLTFHRSFFHPLKSVIIGSTILMVCIGLPIAVILKKYSK